MGKSCCSGCATGKKCGGAVNKATMGKKGGGAVNNFTLDDYIKMKDGGEAAVEDRPGISPAQASNIAGSFAPGSGIADLLGKYPAFPESGDVTVSEMMMGKTNPSFLENLRSGEYGDAGWQLLGGAGDVLMATGIGTPVGAGIKSLSAARLAKKINTSMEAISKSKLANNPLLDTEEGAEAVAREFNRIKSRAQRYNENIPDEMVLDEVARNIDNIEIVPRGTRPTSSGSEGYDNFMNWMRDFREDLDTGGPFGPARNSLADDAKALSEMTPEQTSFSFSDFAKESLTPSMGFSGAGRVGKGNPDFDSWYGSQSPRMQYASDQLLRMYGPEYFRDLNEFSRRAYEHMLKLSE